MPQCQGVGLPRLEPVQEGPSRSGHPLSLVSGASLWPQAGRRQVQTFFAPCSHRPLSLLSLPKPGDPPHLVGNLSLLLASLGLYVYIPIFSFPLGFVCGGTKATSLFCSAECSPPPGNEQRLAVCCYGGRKEEGEGCRGKAALAEVHPHSVLMLLLYIFTSLERHGSFLEGRGLCACPLSQMRRPRFSKPGD